MGYLLPGVIMLMTGKNTWDYVAHDMLKGNDRELCLWYLLDAGHRPQFTSHNFAAEAIGEKAAEIVTLPTEQRRAMLVELALRWDTCFKPAARRHLSE